MSEPLDQQVSEAATDRLPDPPPGALLGLTSDEVPREDLAHLRTEDLTDELLRRLRAGAPGPSVRMDAFGGVMPGHPGVTVELPPADAPGGGLGPVLAMELRKAAEPIIDNRFGRAYFEWAFATFPGERIEGTVCVDLGCGAQNPLAMSMLHVLLGARRTVAVDIDLPQDERHLSWGVAEIASMMLVDPRLVVGSWPVTRAEIAERLDGFDMVELWQGRSTGLDARRMGFVHASADALPLERNEADHVFSTSFFEHVEDVDAVIAELARVIRPGGWTWHLIDGHDHRSYADPSVPQLSFLSEPAEQPMVHGCNRLRPLEFVARFEAAGFEHVSTYPLLHLPVDDAERTTFAEPWRSMPDELLAVRGAVLSFRATESSR